MLAGDGDRLLSKLSILSEKRRVLGGEDNVRETREDPVATRLSPLVLVVFVDNSEHSLSVRREIDARIILGLDFGYVVPHHLELSELLEPRLGDVFNHNVRPHKRVLFVHKIEIRLEVHHVGMERASYGLLDAWAPLAFIVRPVIIRLNKARGMRINADGAIAKKSVVEKVVSGPEALGQVRGVSGAICSIEAGELQESIDANLLICVVRVASRVTCYWQPRDLIGGTLPRDIHVTRM